QVHQQVAENTVDEPWWKSVVVWKPRECDLEFVERILPAFVDARMLAGRAEKQAREKVRKRRMVVPIAEKTPKQIRTAKNRAVSCRRPSDHDVVAASGSCVAAIQHEFFGSKPRQTRLLVQRADLTNQLAPTRSRVEVDLDDAWIGRDLDVTEARIVRWRRPLEHDGKGERRSRIFDSGNQIKVVLGCGKGRHEDMETPVPRLHAERGPHNFTRRLAAPGSYRYSWSH